MPLAKIDITVPDDVWIGDVSSAHPDVVFRVVSTQYDGEIATALVEIEGEDIIQILSQTNSDADIVELDLLWKNEEKTTVQIETTNPELLLPVSRVGIPLKTPFVISDGIASWELFTSHSKLSQLSETLNQLDISYDVESILGFDDESKQPVLTERQQEVLQVAFKEGYYHTPRECTLTQVAESVEITKATCSDILHRAEGKIIGRYLEERSQA